MINFRLFFLSTLKIERKSQSHTHKLANVVAREVEMSEGSRDRLFAVELCMTNISFDDVYKSEWEPFYVSFSLLFENDGR